MTERVLPHRQEIEFFSYEKMYTALHFAEEILSSRYYAEIYAQYANQVANGIAQSISIEGVFGTGYPFYLLSPHLPERFRIEEFHRFIKLTHQKLDDHIKAKSQQGWICPHCQNENRLPDLKTFCKPCGEAIFKPRDLFKALPDIDITIIAPVTSEFLAAIAEYVQKVGLVVSDSNIRDSINAFLAGLELNDPRRYVLVDLHILDTEHYYQSLGGIIKGQTDISTPIVSYRGNGRWDDSERLPFWSDFIFSMTPLGDTNLKGNELLLQTMEAMGREEVEGMVEKLSLRDNRFSRLLNAESGQLIKWAIEERFRIKPQGSEVAFQSLL